MKRFPFNRMILGALAAGLVLRSPALLACAACYGKSDSPLAAGMNWGIMSLLVVVAGVLSAFASFGVYLAKRSASVAAETAAAASGKPVTNPTKEV